MIKGFDEHTCDLSDSDKEFFVPLIVRGLKNKIGKDNAITSSKMLSGLLDKGRKIDASKLRKLIHHIRLTGLVECLIATSKGYYIATEKKEMQDYVDSLIQRSESIMIIANQMDFQFKSKFKKD